MCEVVFNKTTKLPARRITTRNGLMESPPDDSPAEIYYDELGRPKKMMWRIKGTPHRDIAKGPAMIIINPKNGINVLEHYKNHGKSHRNRHEPAYIERDDDGNITRTEFYLDGQKLRPKANCFHLN